MKYSLASELQRTATALNVNVTDGEGRDRIMHGRGGWEAQDNAHRVTRGREQCHSSGRLCVRASGVRSGSTFTASTPRGRKANGKQENGLKHCVDPINSTGIESRCGSVQLYFCAARDRAKNCYFFFFRYSRCVG